MNGLGSKIPFGSIIPATHHQLVSLETVVLVLNDTFAWAAARRREFGLCLFICPRCLDGGVGTQGQRDMQRDPGRCRRSAPRGGCVQAPSSPRAPCHPATRRPDARGSFKGEATSRALTAGVAGGGRGWGEVQVIYLLRVYSESINHSSGTCPVFHLLLCLPQRPNSLGKE